MVISTRANYDIIMNLSGSYYPTAIRVVKYKLRPIMPVWRATNPKKCGNKVGTTGKNPRLNCALITVITVISTDAIFALRTHLPLMQKYPQTETPSWIAKQREVTSHCHKEARRPKTGKDVTKNGLQSRLSSTVLMMVIMVISTCANIAATIYPALKSNYLSLSYILERLESISLKSL